MAAQIVHAYTSSFIEFSTIVDTINECAVGSPMLSEADQRVMVSLLPMTGLIKLADRSAHGAMVTAHEFLKRLFGTFFSRVKHMSTLWDVLDSAQAVIAGACLLPAMLKALNPSPAVDAPFIDIIAPYDAGGYDDIICYLINKENATLTDSNPTLHDFNSGEIAEAAVYTNDYGHFRLIRSASSSPIRPFLSYQFTHLMQFATSTGLFMPYHSLTLSMRTMRQTAAGFTPGAETAPFRLVEPAAVVESQANCGVHPACGATWRSLADDYTLQLPWRERETMRTFERYRWRIGGLPCSPSCQSVLNEMTYVPPG